MIQFKVRLKPAPDAEDLDRESGERAETILRPENLERLSQLGRKIQSALLDTSKPWQRNSSVEVKICSLGKTCDKGPPDLEILRWHFACRSS